MLLPTLHLLLHFPLTVLTLESSALLIFAVGALLEDVAALVVMVVLMLGALVMENHDTVLSMNTRRSVAS